MKIVTAFVISCVVVLATALPAHATDLILTEAQIASIQKSCPVAKQALERLHSADALLRVNLGQRYTSINRRLMTPFISRASINGLDTVSLNTTSVQFRKEIDVFAASYIAYETSLSRAQDIDCEKDPVGFYTAIEIARENRLAVYSQTRKLSGLIDEFRTGVDGLKSSLPGAEQ